MKYAMGQPVMQSYQESTESWKFAQIDDIRKGENYQSRLKREQVGRRKSQDNRGKRLGTI